MKPTSHRPFMARNAILSKKISSPALGGGVALIGRPLPGLQYDLALWEGHAIYARGQFMIKALYGMWNLNGEGPKAVGKDEQLGWYIEPSYKFNEQWGIFARYNFWDNSAGNDADTEYEQADLGFNYWPHPNIVLKLDYQMQDTPDGKNEFDGFNIGLGYQFY